MSPRTLSRRRAASPSRVAPSGQAPRLELPPPELVVVTHREARVRAIAEGTSVASAGDSSDIGKLLKKHKATIHQLFGVHEDRLSLLAATATPFGATVPDLSVYYRVDAPAAAMEALASELQASDVVAAAYVKPPAEPADLNEMAPAAEQAPAVTPDFTMRQGYLDPAPGGIDARYAWTVAGGSGANVRIVDVEGAWRFSHEDLLQNQGGVIGGTPSADIGWRNHGTAVVGEFSGDGNGMGITGISPDANVRAISIFGGTGSAGAIRLAADALGPGDVILIELHRPGPRHAFANRADQLGYIAVEWWPDDFDAIRYAIGRGVIVVEAGGNGAESLDDPIYNAPATGFPAGWTNPFNRSNRDSGAILVGAGAPPPGTHGRDHGPDRSRLDFSNYGASIDAQGWGREVTSTGYGDLQGGTSEDVWYTDQFSGTSSASPILVGAVASLQGVARARGRVLTNLDVRQLLRSTGSPQQDAPGRPATQRIGNRPDLRGLVAAAFKVKEFKELVREKGLRKEKLEVKEKDEKEGIRDKNPIKEKVETKEKVENKEGIQDKGQIKEKVEVKEKVETKEGIRDKGQIKEKVEVKEKFEKEGIQDKGLIKEGKPEVEGKPFERKDLEVGGQFDRRGGGPEATAGADALSDRLGRLEALVDEIAHFIVSDMRPDLGAGALSQEGDLGGSGKGGKETKDFGG